MWQPGTVLKRPIMCRRFEDIKYDKYEYDDDNEDDNDDKSDDDDDDDDKSDVF